MIYGFHGMGLHLGRYYGLVQNYAKARGVNCIYNWHKGSEVKLSENHPKV
jgi:hypothetical protein